MYAVYCVDKPGRGDVRLANRQAHLDFLGTCKDKLVMVGPMLSEDGAAMIGSLLVLDYADRAAVEAHVAADPYTKAELFESVVIRRFKKVLP